MGFNINLLIYFLLFLSLFFSNRSKNKIFHNLKYYFSFVFAIWIIHPYWLFLESSAIGFFDETELVIINFLKFLKQGNIENNFHLNFAGGTKILDTFYLTKINYLFFFNLLKIFPEYIAASIYRFLSIISFYAGFYFLLKKLINFEDTRYFDFFIVASVALFALPYEYGWTFGGTGFLYASLVWLVNIILYSKNFIQQLFLLFLFACLISIIGVTAVYFLPCSITFLFFYFLYFNKNFEKKFLASLIIFYSIYLILNYDIFYLLGSFEARFSEDENISKFENVYNEFNDLIIFFSQGIDILKNNDLKTGNLYPPLLFFNILIFIFLCVSNIVLKSLKNIIIIGLFIFAIFFMQIFKHLLPDELGFIKSYSYKTIFNFCYPLILILVFENMVKLYKLNLFRHILNTIQICFVFLLGYSLSNLNDRSLNSIKLYGGWDMLKYTAFYEYLNEISEEKFRFVSLKNSPKSSFLSYNRLKTFDGVRFNNEISKSIYFKHLTNLKILSINSNQRHFVKEIDALNNKLLAIAGVKFIVSQEMINSKNFKFIQRFKFKNILTEIDLYIYENKIKTWDLVFAPYEAQFIEDESQQDYFNKLENLEYNSILIEKKKISIPSYSNELEIKEFFISKNKISIRLNKKHGYLVLNFPRKKNLSFFCDGKDTIFQNRSVNMIMQLVHIDKKCDNIDVHYN